MNDLVPILSKLFRYGLTTLAAALALLTLYLLISSILSCWRSKVITAVAARHLRTRAISWVAMVLMAGVVCVYLVIISVMEGIKEHYMDKLQSILAHATVSVGDLPWGIMHPKKWAREIKEVDPGIRAVTIGLETPVYAMFQKYRSVGNLRGIDLPSELASGRLQELLRPQDLTEFGYHEQDAKRLPGCIVGGAWRKSYGLKIGDMVTFVFTAENEDEEAPPRFVAFKIIGFFEGKNPYLEYGAYVDRKVLADKMNVTDCAKTLYLWLEDPHRPDLDLLCQRVATKMKQLLERDEPEYAHNARLIEVQTWQQQQNAFYEGITRDNQIMRFIMGIFLALVALIVFLIFGRLVAEKVRDIGALRACGATPLDVRSCFLVQALLIALGGVLLGLLFSGVMISWLSTLAVWFGVDLFPTESFGPERIPAHTLPFDVLLISFLTFASALIGAFFPAWRASRMNPVECLRHE